MSTGNLIPTQPSASSSSGATAAAPKSAVVANPFFAALSTQFTENGALTLATSGNKCLDVFTGLMEGVDGADVAVLLDAAWKESPLSCLKLIFYTLDVREGKSCNAVFYACAKWMLAAHPETYLSNLQHISAFGFWKDLLNILVWCLMGDQDREVMEGHNAQNKALFARSRAKNERRTFRNQGAAKVQEHVHAYKAARDAIKERRAKKMVDDAVYARLYDATVALFAAQLKQDLEVLLDPTADKSSPMDVEKSGKQTKHKDIEMDDSDWVEVEKKEEEAVAVDADAMEVEEKSSEAAKKPSKISISLAAKWLGSEKGGHDSLLGFYEAVALKIEGIEPMEEGGKVKKEVADWAKMNLRKKYVAPLRKHLAIVESQMSAKEWASIQYSKVPSVSMKRNAPVFNARDGERYREFMASAAKGEQKVNVAALKPHEIVSRLLRTEYYYENEDSDELKVRGIPQHEVDLYNALWLNYVAKIKELGGLTSTLAIVDVSGSMSGVPMEVAIALGLLISEITAAPWNNAVISFSEEPAFHEIVGQTLHERVQFVAALPWTLSTNVISAFEMILERAQAHGLAQESMVSTLLILSDMQFNEADGGRFNTSFEVIKEKYKAAGYDLPRLVFWNLRSSHGSHGTQPTPVTADENGTCMLSGYSGNLMKLLLEGKELKAEEQQERLQENSLDLMRMAIEDSRFDCLVVVD